jgi:hypothetical protein
MGLERFDKLFGGERGAAEKTLAQFKKTYGRKDGQTMFDAQLVKRKRKQTRRPKR